MDTFSSWTTEDDIITPSICTCDLLFNNKKCALGKTFWEKHPLFCSKGGYLYDET